LEATAEGRAVLANARLELGEILQADGLVPLAALRLRRGLTQQQLAELSGIQQPQLSRIESGAHDILTATAARLAAALGVTVPEVVDAVLLSQARAGATDLD
jgi:transcriptional regulator with XRE-family HTH domain